MSGRISAVGASAVLLAVLWSQSASAQGGCGDIDFSDEIDRRFPNAQEACIEIVEVDGREFAHFQARLVDVRGDTVEAQFRAPDGTYSDTIAFTPPSDARVRIEGRSYRYSQLSPGQELDVYLPPDRWAIAVHDDPLADFTTAQSVTTVPIEEPAPADERTTRVATLPSTASPLPLITLLGAAFIGLGALVMRIARRR